MTVRPEWFEEDYYQTLGVSNRATHEEIARGYRTLAKQCHPDAHPGREDRFRQISNAYQVLGDSVRRQEYDEVCPRRPTFGALGRPDAGGGTDSALRVEGPPHQGDPFTWDTWASTRRGRDPQWWTVARGEPSRQPVHRRRRRYLKLTGVLLAAAAPLAGAASLGIQSGLIVFWAVMEFMFVALLAGAAVGGSWDVN